MKLRNKKTGEIVDLSIFGIELNIRKENQPIYHSLAELNEEWEDYKPAEPLIKDERIREAVREWAKMNKLERVAVEPPTADCAIISFTYGMLQIGFFLGRSDIRGGTYTIAELCGEEEE